MAIEENISITRFVAAADWTDESTVVLRMRKKKRTEMTPEQAILLAAELVEAAGEALLAAAQAVRDVEPVAVDLIGIGRMSPDCAAGKHPASWLDMAWSDELDTEVPCECPCHAASTERAA